MTKRERELTIEVERLHAIIAWMREHDAHEPALVEWEVRDEKLCLMVCTSGLNEKQIGAAAFECLKAVGFAADGDPEIMGSVPATEGGGR